MPRTTASGAGRSSFTTTGDEAREGKPPGATTAPAHPVTTDVQVLIIGAGQAGLGLGYHLSRNRMSFAIVDGAGQVGDSWRRRWDSLSLFTPRAFSSLPGLRLPPDTRPYPGKDDIATYLQRYAERFDLPIQLNRQVESLARHKSGFTARTASGEWHAEQVVLASGPFHGSRVPACAARLDAGIRQLHSFDYRNPADIPTDDVLVVGGGNSGAQLACELSGTHRVTLATDGPLWFIPESVLGVSVYWWLFVTGVLNARADARVSRYIRSRGDAIVGRDLQRKIAAGQVLLHPHRLCAARDDQVNFADGTQMRPAAILWCTGFRPNYQWINVPGALDETGSPAHDRGVSPAPGLHWLGLPWQTRLNSSLINGIDRDAKALAARLGRER